MTAAHVLQAIGAIGMWGVLLVGTIFVVAFALMAVGFLMREW